MKTQFVCSQQSLSGLGCDTPNCSHDHTVLFFHPRCHNKGVSAAYNKQTGNLSLTCRICDKPLIAIAVADGGNA